eukprot:m.108882 g.108882  ORF g.108882 m.108882 type:complete len:188 (-) comp15942_c0_seq3:204-767(-)
MPTHFGVFKEPKGILKVILIALSLLAWSVAVGHTTVNTDYKDSFFDGKGRFFVFVCVFLWLAEMGILAVYVFLKDNLVNLPFNYWLAELIFSVVWAFLAILSAGLWASRINDIPSGADADTKGWEFAIAMGFLTSFVLLANCYYLYKEARDSPKGFGFGGSGGSRTTTTTTTTGATNVMPDEATVTV